MTMQRTSFKSKAPRRVQRDRSDEFASVVLRPTPARMATVESIAGPAAPLVAIAPKLPRQARTVQAIRDSARGEECTVRITGICRGGTEHTIWSHAPLKAAGKGLGIKAFDVAGCYCCTACDAVVDGQAPMPAGTTRQDVMLDWFYGHVRSLVKLAQKGLI